MKINVEIDDKYETPSITIQTNKWTDELQQLIDYIKAEEPMTFFGIDGDQTVILKPETIDYFFAENRKVYAVQHSKRIEIRLKLFELEKRLANQSFMRFSKSVIGNVNKINRFELSFNGNLCVYFHSGNKEYISRKYVAEVKRRLSMGGNNHAD